MNEGLVNIKYNEEDIMQIAEKMHEHYDIIFNGKRVPIIAIRNLAKELECYPQTEEDKIYALELAARVKYEVIEEIEYIVSGLKNDPMYFKYKSNSFSINKALSSIYNYEDNYIQMPTIIEKAVKNANNFMDYEAFNYKRLTLNKMPVSIKVN